MHIIDWILLLIIAIALGLAIRSIRNKKKNGSGCCGNCCNCGKSHLPQEESCGK